MSRSLLVLNAGSSSIKFAVYRTDGESPERLVRGKLDGIGVRPEFSVKGASGEPLQQRLFSATEVQDHRAAIIPVDEFLRSRLPGETPLAVGHRIVHGGARFLAPARVDDATLAELEALVSLDPLHQLPSLTALKAARARYPDAVHVACFDTAFHRSHSEIADTIALPRELREAGLRRYGFHGLSYEYIARRLREIDPAAARGRVVVAHLGNGASLCALKDGRSVDSTMSFTALDGLVMGTRPGALDAGAVLWLLGRGWDRERISHLLWHESGLLALSETSPDLRDLLGSDAPAARLAVGVFVLVAVKQAAGMAAALGGLDALVFTAGIGENQPETRARISAGLRFLGVELDEEANRRGDLRISREGAPIPTYVIPTDEESVIARHTLSVWSGKISQT
jgi:acetate kinase